MCASDAGWMWVQSIKDVTVPEGMLKFTIVEAEHIPKGDYIQDASPYVE